MPLDVSVFQSRAAVCDQVVAHLQSLSDIRVSICQTGDELTNSFDNGSVNVLFEAVVLGHFPTIIQQTTLMHPNVKCMIIDADDPTADLGDALIAGGLECISTHNHPTDYANLMARLRQRRARLSSDLAYYLRNHPTFVQVQSKLGADELLVLNSLVAKRSIAQIAPSLSGPAKTDEAVERCIYNLIKHYHPT